MATIWDSINSLKNAGSPDIFSRLFQQGAPQQYGLYYTAPGTEGPNTPEWVGEDQGALQRLQPYMNMSGADLQANWGSLPADIKAKLGNTPEEFAKKVSYAPDGQGGWTNTFVEKGEGLGDYILPALIAGVGGLGGGLWGPGAAAAGAGAGAAGATGAFDLGGLAGGVPGAGSATGWTAAGGFPGLSGGPSLFGGADFAGKIPNISELYTNSGGGSTFGGSTAPFNVGSYDPSNPFGFTGTEGSFPGTSAGSGGGVENFLPGGQFSQYGTGGGMIDLGGAGVIGGVNLGGSTGGLVDLFKSLPSNVQDGLKQLLGKTGDGSYQFPFGKVLGGLLESYGQKQYSNDLQGYLNKSLDYADPFHNERPRYQAQFRNLTSTPSNFFNDPAIKAAVDFEDQATSRKLASQGYNMSGNFANDVAQTRMREAFKQYMPYSDMIGTAAGYKFGPGASGQIAASGGQGIAASNQAAMGGLGAAFNDATSGAQPSYLQQIMGQGSNKSLWDMISTPGVA